MRKCEKKWVTIRIWKKTHDKISKAVYAKKLLGKDASIVQFIDDATNRLLGE